MSKRVAYYYGSRYSGYRSPVVDRVNLFALLRRSLRMFRSRWWIALVTLSISTGIAVYHSMTTPDTYRAVSRLSISPRVAFSQRSGDRAVVLEEKSNFAEDQIEYMRGSSVLGRVEEIMQAARPADQGVPSKKLTVTQGQGSTFIMMVDSVNLEYARQFARTWASEFLKFKEQMRSDVAQKQMGKTRVDANTAETEVNEATHLLDDFVRQHRIATSQDMVTGARELLLNLQRQQQNVSVMQGRLESKSAAELADDRTAPLEAAAATVAAANSAVTSAQSSAATSTSAASDLGSAASSTDLTAADAGDRPTDTFDPMDKFQGKSSYRELKLKREQYDAEYKRQTEFLKVGHPYMVRLAESRNDVELQIGMQLKIIEEMRQARISSLKQEYAVLDRQITTQRGEVERLQEISRRYQALNDDLNSKKSLMIQYQRDMQALEAIPTSEERFTILEEGVASDQPIAPMRARIILIGVALGLVSGIGLIFLLHRLDDRTDSAEDLEKALDEPILGQIPLLSRKDVRSAPIVLIDDLEANNIFVEAFRGVRSSVMFGELGGERTKDKTKVLMATSSVPGDGKSTFTANFAITLANAGNRVLLIDADLRRGAVAGAFNVPAEPGLSDVLGGLENWTDVLNATKHRTLLVITSGKSVTNPGEMLLSKIIKRVIEEARSEFDYVIFDSPPIIGMDDAPTLATHCDGLLFVYRVGVTSLKLAKLAVNTVRQRNGRILGLILNGVSIANPDYYYTAYYYSHYTYGPKAPKRLPDGEPEEPHRRPAGARLLSAMREGETHPNPVATHEILLSEDRGPIDVQESPADNPSVDNGRPPASV